MTIVRDNINEWRLEEEASYRRGSGVTLFMGKPAFPLDIYSPFPLGNYPFFNL